MLLGKLNEPAQKLYEKSAFEIVTYTADYIAVRLENYVIGQYPITVDVKFGNIVDNPLPAARTPDWVDPVLRIAVQVVHGGQSRDQKGRNSTQILMCAVIDDQLQYITSCKEVPTRG